MIPFASRSAIILAGPSKSGKTEFTLRLLKHVNEMFEDKFERIIWCYSELQTLDLPPGTEMVKGLPDMDELRQQASVPKLLILDDLMCDIGNVLTELFTKGCHHLNMTVVYLTQNVFYGKQRTARLSASYIVLFKSPGNELPIATLARQMYPRNGSKYFIEAYRDATKKPHTYLLVDLTQTIDENLRLRATIFPDETCTVYVIKRV